jgi:hypothetical protein
MARGIEGLCVSWRASSAAATGAPWYRANRWWWDVLENGPSSQYADYFDVDWEASEAKLHNLVSLPILGGHYGDLLESGEISIHRDGGSFDHLVSAGEQRRRHREAEGLGSSQINDKLELGGTVDRQVGRFGAF